MVLDYTCSGDDIRASGLSCTIDDPCPVFLELDAVEAVGDQIFVAGNLHSSSTTLASVLLASDDAGQTWREPHERIHLAGLDRIQFVDFENGWAAGEVQHPLPRDPFLLATTDGGKTWDHKPVFADGQFGSVVQFWFSSRTNGSLIIDRGQAGESGRYELYETANGGDSWILRQSSEKLIELMRASPNTDWRVRADGSSKSYVVERRTNGAWRKVAAFSISAGACQPPVPEAPVPPTESLPTAPQ